MMSTDDDDIEPSWLDTGNDQMHRKEVEPLLFGTGKLALTDPDKIDDAENPFDDSDESKEPKKQQPNKGYGSTESTTPTPPSRSSLWTIPTAATSPVCNDDIDLDFDNDHDDSKQGDSDGDCSTEISFHERSGRPLKPTRHWLVRIFFAIQSYALMVNLALLVSQVLPMVFVPLTDSDKGYIALKTYLCIFAIIFLVLEIDHPSIPFLRKASFLKTYASRGFLYTFFGLICFEEAYSEKAHKALQNTDERLVTVFNVSWFALVNLIAAGALMSLGILYVLMGICCLQRVRNRYVYGDRQKWKAYREAIVKWGQEA